MPRHGGGPTRTWQVVLTEPAVGSSNSFGSSVPVFDQATLTRRQWLPRLVAHPGPANVVWATQIARKQRPAAVSSQIEWPTLTCRCLQTCQYAVSNFMLKACFTYHASAFTSTHLFARQTGLAARGVTKRRRSAGCILVLIRNRGGGLRAQRRLARLRSLGAHAGALID